MRWTRCPLQEDVPDDCSGHESDLLVRENFDRVVQVALVCEHDGELQLVDRVVSRENDQLTAIVEQLFLGTTPEEATAGLHSSFSPHTAGQFDEVRIGADGEVVIDLGPGFITANNFSTSFMSGQVFDQIAQTMFAVPEVAGVEFTFDGQRWCGWEAGPCESVPRPVIARR
jgi:spore germination protein GerM